MTVRNPKHGFLISCCLVGAALVAMAVVAVPRADMDNFERPPVGNVLADIAGK